ncbi:uncharacterized protein LOC133036132 [Cannabis sativa]|uniref:uncharacterized protein LOC133036132 n=1 Tax=Cannabis sativa TaxID=3483 RepID=UPI0029CA91F6|nr:uncharacterized protein LOC133036132 [Cannabis sativa]
MASHLQSNIGRTRPFWRLARGMARTTGFGSPGCLGRTSKGDIGKKDGLLPRTEEEAFVRTISYDGVENLVDDALWMTREVRRVEGISYAYRIFLIYIFSATRFEPRPGAPSASGVRGAEYTDLVARLDRIEGDTRGPSGSIYPTTTASPPVEEDEVFPDDYDPYEGAPATPIEAQPLIHVHDTESQGEILSIEAQPAVVKSRKRKRKPPVWFGDYTEMKRRHRPSSTFDPLEPPDEKLLTTFRKWCVGLIPNHRLRDLRSGDYGPGFFWIMLTPKEWLTDDHIDAAMHMLRRRRTDYPLTFPQKGIILSTFVTAMISSAWTSHKGPRKNFKWEEYILDYCTGFHKSQVFERWRGNEFIYFVTHIPTARQRVTVEVDIEPWKINVYGL